MYIKLFILLVSASLCFAVEAADETPDDGPGKLLLVHDRVFSLEQDAENQYFLVELENTVMDGVSQRVVVVREGEESAFVVYVNGLPVQVSKGGEAVVVAPNGRITLIGDAGFRMILKFIEGEGLLYKAELSDRRELSIDVRVRETILALREVSSKVTEDETEGSFSLLSRTGATVGVSMARGDVNRLTLAGREGRATHFRFYAPKLTAEADAVPHVPEMDRLKAVLKPVAGPPVREVQRWRYGSAKTPGSAWVASAERLRDALPPRWATPPADWGAAGEGEYKRLLEMVRGAEGVAVQQQLAALVTLARQSTPEQEGWEALFDEGVARLESGRLGGKVEAIISAEIVNRDGGERGTETARRWLRSAGVKPVQWACSWLLQHRVSYSFLDELDRLYQSDSTKMRRLAISALAFEDRPEALSGEGHVIADRLMVAALRDEDASVSLRAVLMLTLWLGRKVELSPELVAAAGQYLNGELNWEEGSAGVTAVMAMSLLVGDGGLPVDFPQADLSDAAKRAWWNEHGGEATKAAADWLEASGLEASGITTEAYSAHARLATHGPSTQPAQRE